MIGPTRKATALALALAASAAMGGCSADGMPAPQPAGPGLPLSVRLDPPTGDGPVKQLCTASLAGLGGNGTGISMTCESWPLLPPVLCGLRKVSAGAGVVTRFDIRCDTPRLPTGPGGAVATPETDNVEKVTIGRMGKIEWKGKSPSVAPDQDFMADVMGLLDTSAQCNPPGTPDNDRGIRLAYCVNRPKARRNDNGLVCAAPGTGTDNRSSSGLPRCDLVGAVRVPDKGRVDWIGYARIGATLAFIDEEALLTRYVAIAPGSGPGPSTQPQQGADPR